jgi:hypothetical protein
MKRKCCVETDGRKYIYDENPLFPLLLSAGFVLFDIKFTIIILKVCICQNMWKMRMKENIITFSFEDIYTDQKISLFLRDMDSPEFKHNNLRCIK